MDAFELVEHYFDTQFFGDLMVMSKKAFDVQKKWNQDQKKQLFREAKLGTGKQRKTVYILKNVCHFKLMSRRIDKAIHATVRGEEHPVYPGEALNRLKAFYEGLRKG